MREEAIISARLAFSTLAFPQTDLATAVSLGRSWGYAGVELRLIDGELIDPAMRPGARAQVKRTLAVAGLPVVAVDTSIRLTGERPGTQLRQFLELASDWEAPLIRVFGGALPGDPLASGLLTSGPISARASCSRRSKMPGPTPCARTAGKLCCSARVRYPSGT